VIAAIPLGGYVKMLDEREGEVEDKDLDQAFNRKSVWARIAIVSAGPIFNLIFTLLVPEDSTEEHLQVLSTIAEIFSNTGICTSLRACETGSCLLEQLSLWESQRIPA